MLLTSKGRYTGTRSYIKIALTLWYNYNLIKISKFFNEVFESSS